MQAISHRLTNSFPAHRHRPSLCAAIVSAGVQVLEARGLELERLQADWGVRLGSLHQPYLRLPAFLARRFWELARELSGDPAIGVAAALQANPSQLLGLAYLMQLMPSRLAALEKMAHYWPLVAGHLQLLWEEEAGLLHLALVPSQSLRPAVEELDYWGALLLQHLKGPFGAPAAVRELRLRRTEPVDPTPWLEQAGGTVHFAAGRDELVLDLAALATPRPAGSPAVCAALEAALEDYAAQTSCESVLESVASAVLVRLQEDLSLELLAERLHMTPRTLHRALQREGWSFSEIVEMQRRYLAFDLLQGGVLTVTEVADRLGYSEVSNFLRAFRRWYGVSPGAFREGLGGQS